MRRFAFCDVAPLGCPGCGGTGFYNGEPIVWLRVAWGLVVAQKPVPGFDYEVGDQTAGVPASTARCFLGRSSETHR